MLVAGGYEAKKETEKYLKKLKLKIILMQILCDIHLTNGLHSLGHVCKALNENRVKNRIARWREDFTLPVVDS